MSQITTHALDTSTGCPAANLPVSLYLLQESNAEKNWQLLADATTNADGRVADLLDQDEVLKPGTYRIKFDTAVYFAQQEQKGFYPYVDIVFSVGSTEGQHYRIPLLLSPFGYSTYRGS